jgi:membrane protein
MPNTQPHVYNFPPTRYLFRKAHRILVPGLNGASLFEVGKFFSREMKTLKLQERAAAVTYNFLMAMPPTFLLLFSILPYLPLKNVEQTILNLIKLLSPNHNFYVSVHAVVSDFMSQQHRDVLSYGVILVLFFSSNGVMGLMRSFDKSMTLYKKRTGVQRRWTAVKLTLVLLVVVIIGLSVLIMQSRDLNPYITKVFHSVLLVKMVSFLILALLVFTTISIIYTYGPSLTHKFRFVSAGSVFATIVSIMATSIFFFLVNNFLNYNKLYGSIGTLIAFMVWLWINTLIILMGYELNVSLLLGKLSHTGTEEGEEVPDDDSALV